MENFNMEQLENAKVTSINKGDIVTGKVLKVDSNTVFVDIGYKMEGKIDISEFNSPPRMNDEIEVMVIEKDEYIGELLLSYKQAKFMKAWKNILEIYNDTKYISGIIERKLNNGYEVDIGIIAFLPFSQIRHTENFEDLREKQLMFKIIDIKQKFNKVILSRRQYVEEVNEKNRKETLEKIEEGQIIEGVVKNITRFGVFLDINGIDALIPRSELSWSINVDPKDIVAINQKIKAMILNFDKRLGKITLSLKNLQSNPWNTVDEKYQEGMIAKGKVLKIINSGVFIELEPGIEGFIAKENLTWAKHIKSPFEVLTGNDLVEFKILKIDKMNKKIALGLKQILPNPWMEISKKYYVGQKISGKVKFIVKNGAYIEIDENIEGFLDLNDVSWTKKFITGFDAFKKGEVINAVITDISAESQLLKLNLKQLLVNPWEVLNEKITSKMPVDVTVDKVMARGSYIKMENDLNGFIPATHYDYYHSREQYHGKEQYHIKEQQHHKEQPPETLHKGDKVKCLIIDIDQRNKLAICSIKEYKRTIAEKEMEKYIKKDSSGGMKLGDMINLNQIMKKE
ncbi:MAG: S1 RNA-binding domain-containing protein [bacterium]|nr:S1 RNA-binding domain-containing protein [bacterium]